ncbi:MAG: DUF362 domain-containing protein [Nitrospirae bacterium]|nr:DUF362 domain-containing protein [Nitrospirota bacterium]
MLFTNNLLILEVSKVIARESAYEYDILRKDIFDILALLDNGVITSGKVVLIKPNLLRASPVEQAITTHPLIIRFVAEYVLEKGARPLVMDSPAIGKFSKIVKDTGLVDALKGLDITLEEFTASVRIDSHGSAKDVDDLQFKETELAQEALQADCIINLPKLKTHTQMGLTLAVKNLFGCVVGLRKPEWHLKIGENRDKFAELLISIYRRLRPTINILDGILALEGNGPGTGGIPRQLGVLIAANDAVDVDVAVCQMLDLHPEWLPTNRVAKRLGLIKDISIDGRIKKVKGFVLPNSTSLVFGPSFARKFIRQNLTSSPVSDKKLCKLCNECVNICPAKAITNNGKTLHFDYDKCIRCYCCSEVCPHSAIKVQRPLLRRFF